MARSARKRKTAVASAAPPALPRPPISRRKKWLFRAAAVACSCLILAGFEVTLRVAGIGHDLALVIPVAGVPEELKYQFNERADLPFFSATDLTGPEPRRFDLPRPEGTYRIVVLGESTVNGFPYPTDLAFPRQLELILQHQIPGRKIEVLNAGVTAVNSFVIADLAEQALAAQPDLLVIHAGHNEFYGPGGVASTSGRLPAPLLRASFSLRRLRFGQLYFPLARLSAGSGKELGEQLPAELNIPFDGPIMESAVRHLHANLQRIINAARRRNVPVLFTTVASNLRDQSPIRAAHSRPLSPADQKRWTELVHAGEQLLKADEAGRALVPFEEAAQIDPHHAQLLYRQGQCLDALQRYDEALSKFEEARDRDGCRFRAPSRFRDVIHEAASTHDAGPIHFLDWAKEAALLTSPRAPGHELFLEHVHYSFEGNYQLALRLATFIQTDINRQPWNPDQSLPIEEVRLALRVSPFDEIAARSFAMQMTQTQPFAQALESASHAQWLTNDIRQRYAVLSPDDQNVFASLSMTEMQLELPTALARVYTALGNQSRGLTLHETAVTRRPWDVELRVTYAQALHDAGRPSEALEQVDRAIRLDSAHPALVALRKKLVSSSRGAGR